MAISPDGKHLLAFAYYGMKVTNPNLFQLDARSGRTLRALRSVTPGMFAADSRTVFCALPGTATLNRFSLDDPAAPLEATAYPAQCSLSVDPLGQWIAIAKTFTATPVRFDARTFERLPGPAATDENVLCSGSVTASGTMSFIVSAHADRLEVQRFDPDSTSRLSLPSTIKTIAPRAAGEHGAFLAASRTATDDILAAVSLVFDTDSHGFEID